MEWYKQKFSSFFKRWKKGYLYTRGGQTHYGTVKKLSIEDDFEQSSLTFLSADPLQSETVEMEIPLKEIIYFRAADGPIFNVDKYISILQMQRAGPEIKRQLDGADTDKDLVCVAFGLEFYASPKVAETLTSDLNNLIRSRLTNTPLVQLKEERRIQLTPTFDTFIQRIKSVFRRG